MLVCYGYNTTTKDWEVKTRGATGFFRIYFVEKGSAIYKAQSEEVILKPNHLYIFPNTVSYELMGCEDERITHLYLHITTASLIASKVTEVCIENINDVNYLLKTFIELIITDKIKDSIDMQNGLSQGLMDLLALYGYFEKIDDKISNSIRYILNNLNTI